MNALNDTVLRFGNWLTQVAPTPSPSPSGFGVFTGDEDTITPGWIGFALTFLIAIAVVFLLIDMNRRVRRVRYREEIREKIAAEHEQPEA
jgi:hypothetical protein